MLQIFTFTFALTLFKYKHLRQIVINKANANSSINSKNKLSKRNMAKQGKRNLAEQYSWSEERPVCLFLGKTFGEEAQYLYSDMQYAMQTADLFWKILQSDEYAARNFNRGNLTKYLRLDVKHNEVTRLSQQPKLQLVYPEWVNKRSENDLPKEGFRHGSHYFKDSETPD